MNIDGIYRYRTLMSNRVYLDEHFMKRYKQRVSKASLKALDFAKKAYRFGGGPELIKDDLLRKYYNDNVANGRICRIYRGFVCWSQGDKAITVYPISNFAKVNRKEF